APAERRRKGAQKAVECTAATARRTSGVHILRVSRGGEPEQNRALAERRASRDDAAVRAALTAMVDAARGSENMIPAILDAVRAEATLGEICDALRDEWGVYMEPARF